MNLDETGGGLGIIKEYEALFEESYLYLWFERSITPAWGIKGGKDGAKPNVVIRKGQKIKETLKTNAYRMEKGTIVTIYTGGGSE